MDPFPNNPIPNLFVDFNADGTLGDVPDLAIATMIELVVHRGYINFNFQIDIEMLASNGYTLHHH